MPTMWAVALSVVAAFGYHEYAARSDAIQAWFAAKPGLTSVDLSRPGTTVIDLPPAPDVHSHGYRFFIEPGVGAPVAEDAVGFVPKGEIRVEDSRGGQVSFTIADALKGEAWDDGRYFWTTSIGPDEKCTVSVRVEEGAPELAGVGSVVYARYTICELVVLPVLLWALVAWVAGVPAVILAALALWRVVALFRAAPEQSGA